MDIEEQFKGMASAKMTGKGNYLPAGFKGKVKMRPLKYLPNGYKGKSVIFEYELLTSNLESDPAGITRTWVVKLDGNDYANGDLKQIMFALSGLDESKVKAFEVDPAPHNEAMTDFVAAVKDPALIEGLEAIVETVAYTTKAKEGKPSRVIALHKWRPTPESEKERAAEDAAKALPKAA